MFEKLPPDLQQATMGGIATFFLAFLGRLAYHVQEVGLKRRKFWSPHLFWEVFTALAIGFVADGLAAYLGLTGKPVTAVIIVVAYLGPRGLESILIRLLEAYAQQHKTKGK